MTKKEELLICKPIGVIRTSKKIKFDTPHQPVNSVIEENIIELDPGFNFEQALQDLEGFERIWLIWWFNKNRHWRPKVTPPRGTHKKRGLFATRSPHRPCPIGITSVPLISIKGRKLIVGNVDLLDGTPILDIKPYIAEVDCFPNQRQGWLDQEKEELLKPVQFEVIISETAAKQREFLENNWDIEFFKKTISILERTPSRNKSHRITIAKNGIARLSCGVWRVFFSVGHNQVEIIKVAPGYPKELLYKEGFEVIADWQAQRAFFEIWS